MRKEEVKKKMNLPIDLFMERDMLYREMPTTQKAKILINLKLDPQTREDFRLACRLRGASMSGLLHQFIVRTIREERALSPETFMAAAEHRYSQGAEPMILVPERKNAKLNEKEPQRVPRRRKA